MSIESAVHQLIEVVAGRHAVLTPLEADLLHEAVDQVEAKPEPAVDEAELSQEPTEDPAPPSAPAAPINVSGGFPEPLGNV